MFQLPCGQFVSFCARERLGDLGFVSLVSCSFSCGRVWVDVFSLNNFMVCLYFIAIWRKQISE